VCGFRPPLAGSFHWPFDEVQDVSHLMNPTGGTGGFTLKKLIALAAAGILSLSVAAFAQNSAKTETKKEETSTTKMETKKEDSGKKMTTKKTAHKKHMSKKHKTTTKKEEGKTESKEAAPSTK
jgi:mannitol-specific phosphotransferase system IIBC component